MKWIAGLVALPLLAIAVTIQALRLSGHSWGTIFADPADQFDFPVFTGAFSYLGILVLTAGAAIALFAWSLSRGTGGDARALALVSLLTTLLALDDLFMLHERVLRHGLGIDEKLVYAGYALLGLCILHQVRARAFRAEFLGFWLAVAALGVMVGADVVEKWIGTPSLLLLTEEAAKLCGFVLWSGFWIGFARRALIRPRPGRAA